MHANSSLVKDENYTGTPQVQILGKWLGSQIGGTLWDNASRRLLESQKRMLE